MAAQTAALNDAASIRAAWSQIELLLRTAFGYIRENRLEEAETMFRRVLGLYPRSSEAFYGLSLLALMVQRFDDAVELIQTAIELDAQNPEYHRILGRIRREQGRDTEAQASYRASLRLEPDQPETRVSLGISLRASGLLAEAIEEYIAALKRRPTMVEGYVNLINALKQRGDIGFGCAQFEAIIEHASTSAEARFFYGKYLEDVSLFDDARRELAQAEKLDEKYRGAAASVHEGQVDGERRLNAAIAFHRQALVLKPQQPEMHYNLAVALRDAGHWKESIECMEQALKLKPDYIDALLTLGGMLLHAFRVEDAERCQRRVIELRPDHASAHVGLSASLLTRGAVSEAVEAARKAIELRPDDVAAKINLANGLVDQRKQEEAIALYRDILQQAPGTLMTQVNLLFALNYSTQLRPEDLVAEHREFGLKLASVIPEKTNHPNERDPERPLRIGYLSPDFRGHSVAFFIEPVLERHDRSGFEPYCYYTYPNEDGVTKRLKGHVDRWRHCAALSESELAARIEDDRIDILVDLAGYTAHNRIRVAQSKPAPVQMAMLGYPTTMGLPAMDYRISDWQVDPPGYESLNVETVLRLPASYFCYRPGPSPEIGPLPMLRNGYVTFASFNNVAKVTEATLDYWAKVMHAVPDSRLIIKHRSFADEFTASSTIEALGERAIAASRIRVLPWQASGMDHLNWYNEADIGLDTVPYSGATTTCEALWMGVPVVSIPGRSHAGRMSLSILGAAGLAEFATVDVDAAIAQVQRLVAIPNELSRLRQTLREKLSGSALMDEAAYTRALEQLYRDAWRSYCAS